jgi:hypothetical protein
VHRFLGLLLTLAVGCGHREPSPSAAKDTATPAASDTIPVVTPGSYTPTQVEAGLIRYLDRAPAGALRIQTTFFARQGAAAERLAEWFRSQTELTVEVDTLLPASPAELRAAARQRDTVQLRALSETSWNVRVLSPARAIGQAEIRAWVDLLLAAPGDTLWTLGGFGLEQP